MFNCNKLGKIVFEYKSFLKNVIRQVTNKKLGFNIYNSKIEYRKETTVICALNVRSILLINH